MILFISTSQDDIRCAYRAARDLPQGFPEVRVFHAGGNAPDDCMTDSLWDLVDKSDLVIARLLPGARTFEAGLPELVARRRRSGGPLIVCSGINEPDELAPGADAISRQTLREAFEYFRHGGVENMRRLFLFASQELLVADRTPSSAWAALECRPVETPSSGIYVHRAPERHSPGGRPTVGILFYRTHWLSGNTQFVDALIDALDESGCDALPVFCQGLTPTARGDGGGKDPLFALLTDGQGRALVDCLISTLSFSWSRIGDGGDGGWSGETLKSLDVPVLQTASSFGTEAGWFANPRGLSPLELTMSVALPEIDGRIASVPIAFRSNAPAGDENALEAPPDRARMVARMAASWAKLRRKTNREKRVCVVLHSYPASNGRIGNGVGLDTLESTVRLLRALAERGYDVEPPRPLPATGDELAGMILAGFTYDESYSSNGAGAVNGIAADAGEYRRWFGTLPATARERVVQRWGPPGEGDQAEAAYSFAGLAFGKVAVAVQPPRDTGDDPEKIAHDSDLPPPHRYLAFYHWMREGFAADAVIHMGKHGTLEWLPGKGAGLSATCFPEIALGEIPNLYPFIVNDPGEGAQAKRRAHAVIVDHLTPVMTRAGAHGELAQVESLISEYHQAKSLDPGRLSQVESLIVEQVKGARLWDELDPGSGPFEFQDFLGRLEGYLHELTSAQIKHGLHVLGQAPEGERLRDLLVAIAAPDGSQGPGLRAAVARALGFGLDRLLADPGGPADGLDAGAPPRGGIHSNAGALDLIDDVCSQLVEEVSGADYGPEAATSKVLGAEDAAVSKSVHWICEVLRPAIARTAEELDNLLHGLDGGFVPPGPSGAPTRGMANVLPTGRNFYSVDPRALPSRSAWATGVRLAEALLAKHLQDQGRYPESVAIILWGTSAMRTQGEDVAEIMYLLGVRPRWNLATGQVVGLETIALADLGRPRIDVTARISGFFRDAFGNLVDLIDGAIGATLDLDEPDESNFVAKHFREEVRELVRQGVAADAARASASIRIFGTKPGGYGSGILPLLYSRNWETELDIADVFLARSGYAYGGARHGEPARAALERRLRRTSVALKNRDNQEHDIFDSDDYFQEHGGLIASIRALTGSAPASYIGDSSDPARPGVRDLWREGRRAFRTRVSNPKWIESIKRHGYRGGAELAATVDYMFGYDATAKILDDWVYERIAEQYVIDAAMRAFLEDKNPWALQSMAERLLEAVDRGLWQQPAESIVKELRGIYLGLDARFEAQSETRAVREAGSEGSS